MNKAILYQFGERASARVEMAATPGLRWIETRVDGKPEHVYSGLVERDDVASRMTLLARVFGGGAVCQVA